MDILVTKKVAYALCTSKMEVLNFEQGNSFHVQITTRFSLEAKPFFERYIRLLKNGNKLNSTNH